MTRTYETQDIHHPERGRPGFVWRCHRCGRYLGTIERVDGTLEVYHKCGAVNLLSGHLLSTVDTVSDPE